MKAARSSIYVSRRLLTYDKPTTLLIFLAQGCAGTRRKISINDSLPWSVNIRPHADASQPFRPARWYRFQLLPVYFDPGRLPHEVRSRQLLGSRFQHNISCNIGSSVEVSGHELHAFFCRLLNASFQGFLALVPSVPLKSRYHVVGQTPFLASCPSSSSLSLLCSMVSDKRIFQFFPGTLRWRPSRIPDFRIHDFPLDFLCLEMNALFHP